MSRQDPSRFSQCESDVYPIAPRRCNTDPNVAWCSVSHDAGAKQNSYATLFVKTQARRAAVRRDFLLKELSSKISDEKWVSELEQIVLRARAASVPNSSESPPAATLDEAAAKLHAVLAQPSYLPEMPIRDLEVRQETVVEDSVKQLKEDEERFRSIVRLRAKKSSLLISK